MTCHKLGGWNSTRVKGWDTKDGCGSSPFLFEMESFMDRISLK